MRRELGASGKFELAALGEMGFRGLYHKVVFIKRGDGWGAPDDPLFPDYLAYVYVDRTCGLSAHVLGAARLEEGAIEVEDIADDVVLMLRLAGAEDKVGLALGDEAAGLYAKRIDMVNQYYPADEVSAELRDMELLDPLRYFGAPDDLSARLFSEASPNREAEAVWVHPVGFGEGVLLARLLNEPYGDWGVHGGDVVNVVVARFDEGVMALVLTDKGPADLA